MNWLILFLNSLSKISLIFEWMDSMEVPAKKCDTGTSFIRFQEVCWQNVLQPTTG